MIVSGRVWKFGDEINTDLIFPHSALRMKPQEQLKMIFSDNRPGWAEQVKAGDIIIAGRNFGTGSSRPGAALLKRLGLGGMVAESYNGLFYRNCISYGFPAIQCSGVLEIFEEGDIAEIDLTKGIVVNKTKAISATGKKISESMEKILYAGGIDKLLQKEGYME